MTNGKDNQPTIASFLDLLEHQLQERDYDSLLEVLRVVAEHISPEQRYDVLVAINELTTATAHDLEIPRYPELPQNSPGRELVEAAEELARKLEDGHFYTGWGWDEERQEERAWGDERWVHDMDELFGRAATMYLSGGLELALRVYGPLLNTFKHAGRIGVFCGPYPPQQMVQSDIDEVKRRFLRCVYLVTEVEQRPQRLLAEMEALRQVGNAELGLKLLVESDFPGDPTLEGLDVFLPAWIELLKEATRELRAWGREARRLLREAVEMQGGVSGLGELARLQGQEHPEAFHEWVGLLVRTDCVEEAIAAAQEGVKKIQDPAYKARMADRLGQLALRQNNVELAVEAAQKGWRALPTLTRLLNLATAANAAEMLDSVLSLEAGRVLKDEWNHSEALACRILLLTGRHEEAIERFEQADAQGWGRPDNAGAVVFPYLLVLATGRERPPPNSIMWNLWSELDTPKKGYFDRRLLMDQVFAAESSSSGLDEKPYTVLLARAAKQSNASEQEREAMLDVARAKAENVTKELLESQYRRGQSLGAELFVAVAEAIGSVHTPGQGIEYILALEQSFQQYGSFVAELRSCLGRSPILAEYIPEGGKDGPTLVLVK
jgi:tetratricopeptide (TPR) repeat protein